MANRDDVRRYAMAMPEAVQNPHFDNLAWRVPRPATRAATIGPEGVLAPRAARSGAGVAGLDTREQPLAASLGVYFTISHFANCPAVLSGLPEIAGAELRELITEAWICRAPKRLVTAWEKEQETGR